MPLIAVARFGGDEFVMMLTELGNKVSATQATAVAEKVRAALSEPLKVVINESLKSEVFVEHDCTVNFLLLCLLIMKLPKKRY